MGIASNQSKGLNNEVMKRKYADMYYSVKKEEKGWVWKIFFNYKDKKAAQTSLDNEDGDDKYFDTEHKAIVYAVDAIQDHYE